MEVDSVGIDGLIESENPLYMEILTFKALE